MFKGVGVFPMSDFMTENGVDFLVLKLIDESVEEDYSFVFAESKEIRIRMGTSR